MEPESVPLMQAMPMRRGMKTIAIRALLATALIGVTGFAQDFTAAGAGASSAEASQSPASGSGADVSGNWKLGGHQDGGYITASGALVDYGGIPFNEAGRLYALAWPASRQTVRIEQCAGYTVPYAF
jgi:hypothetical protein